jgi:hypothetical protein
MLSDLRKRNQGREQPLDGELVQGDFERTSDIAPEQNRPKVGTQDTGQWIEKVNTRELARMTSHVTDELERRGESDFPH